MMVETKKPIHSKVLWFNILSVAAVVITEILATPEIKEALGGNAYILMIIGALVNAGLRPLTTKPLGSGTPVRRESPSGELNPVEQAIKDEEKDMY